MRLTVIGAGLRTPLILSGLFRGRERLPLDEVVLHDTDGERLRTMSSFAGGLGRMWGARFAVRAEPDPRRALEGADFVFAAIRVGQEEGRVLDERIPLERGVVGQETTGPGGFSMAIRTIPVMLDYARLIGEVAPDAWVVNFTNPAGLITQAISDHTALRVVGICDTPVQMKRSIARFLGVEADRVFLDYFGLNHLGWVRRVLVDGDDHLPAVLDRYEELQREGAEWGLFEPELVRSLGMLPNEYLYFYYHRERALKHLLRSGGTRAEQLMVLSRAVWRALVERLAEDDLGGALRAYEEAVTTRTESYMVRESGRELAELRRREAPIFEGEGYEGLAAAVVASLISPRGASLILNVPNRGSIAGLRDDDVVEVPCSMGLDGPSPLAVGEIPGPAMDLIAPVKAYERRTVEAATQGSYQAAVEALAVHPLVGSAGLARAIVDDYVGAHDDFLPGSPRPPGPGREAAISSSSIDRTDAQRRWMVQAGSDDRRRNGR